MILLDGKATADDIKREIALVVDKIVSEGGKVPHLAAILVGEDGASQTYVGHKEKACAQVGFRSTLLRFPSDISEEFLLAQIDKINNDNEIDGLIVQLPLPPHISEQKVTEAIDPSKDVDGFHPVNVGKMVLGLQSFVSATPWGIIELLKRYDIETSGKNCVIIGRSNIVGRPMANLLSQKSKPGDCTVTMCHSRTKDLREHTLKADIIVAALGVPGFLKGDMVKEGAVVIDVGITRVKADNKSGFRLIGDVLFDEVAPKCSYITPVPGGVGPMTIISLLKNTLIAAEK
ncbi:MAG: tetrahydrofolate dehydrogenase/cyclohydrolase catalytic domain-containing protein [Bacteroidales bacterium]|nr:tetrahydrofolate dehydrogenase/cyclohydrolase catalytic domain-containing protein [Bacteroidales bacterium]MDD3272766.1 tetrahydrofolate dehydrogenase/cyclohydrolase catalytic domain-containing protein [Bacteroidales bacterium]MDD4057273.1 tetrahydrofolate dehydrogenase/cyclohydrolase catalytic domain-containing protein [Bacteroidales bacterium]